VWLFPSGDAATWLSRRNRRILDNVPPRIASTWRISMARAQRSLGLAAAVLLATLLPAAPAAACSCAEATIASISQRDPGAAVARIRRVDEGGGQGLGQVLEVLHGPRLPDEVALAMDTGASCLPWVPVGEVAVVAFEPGFDGWKTMACGMLDPATGLEPVAVDPVAVGPAAVVVFGRIPGAELVALDDHLRVVSVGRFPTHLERAEKCGEDLLVLGRDDEGRAVAALLALPTFAQLARYAPSTDPDDGLELRDARCHPDGTVDLLARTWAPQAELQLHRDVFGDVAVSTLPGAGFSAFVGDAVALLETAPGGRGPSALSIIDVETGELTPVLEHRAAGDEISVAPDGRHALVRGYDDQPLLLVIDLTTSRVVGESRGWWQPTQRPWMGTDRILLVDEDSGGMSGSGAQRFRVVDLSLQEVAALPTIAARTIGAFDGTIVATVSDGLTVLDAEARPFRALDELWLTGVAGALQLGPIVAAPDVVLAANVTPTPESAADAPEATALRSGSGLAAAFGRWHFAALAALAVLAATLLVRRRGARH
jgi:hypothetical protein